MSHVQKAYYQTPQDQPTAVAPTLEETSTTPCAHCGLPAKQPAKQDQLPFCCPGCEFVYHTIHNLGLENFYTLKQKSPAPGKASRTMRESNYAYMDDPRFLEKHVRILDEHHASFTLALDGVHCVACVWIIERLNQVTEGIHQVRLQFAKSLCCVDYDPTITGPASIATTLDSIGYPALPLSPEDPLQKRRRDTTLLRVGVAAVCAANTMIIAIGLYQGSFSGMQTEYRTFFHYMSMLLTLPAIFYSAAPFYRAALGGLRAGALHLDLPISLGISVGFALSAYNTLMGFEHVYFDSLCILIFLLLGGRWLHRCSIQKAADLASLTPALLPQVVHTLNRGDAPVEDRYIGSVSPGTLLLVRNGEVVPADGVVIQGEPSLDLSLLTGESRPVRHSTGAQVHSGTRCVGENFIFRVTDIGETSRLGRMMERIEVAGNRKAPLIQVTDRIGQLFLRIALSLAALTFLIWLPAGITTALSHTMALLVITCPCALGLAAPITMAIAISRAARRGILIQGTDTIERLAETTRVYFDKTGTLTLGQGSISSFRMLPASASLSETLLLPSVREEDVLKAIATLEHAVDHPIAEALRKFCSSQTFASTLTFHETKVLPGSGVKGKDSKGRTWHIGGPRLIASLSAQISKNTEIQIATLAESGLSPVLVFCNSSLIACAGFGDNIHPDSSTTLSALRASGRDIALLSGDDPRIVHHVGRELQISRQLQFASASPEDKTNILEQEGRGVAMIGDGMNDAGALAAAFVGIGIRGGAENCLNVSDVYLASGKIEDAAACFEGADRTLRIIHRNLRLSLVYNVVGAGAALCGLVDPLLAAVLMPLSSLTVILLSTCSRSY